MHARFCTACGAELQRRGARSSCPACHGEVVESPRPEAAVVVRRDRDVLLVRRGAERDVERWGLPAGYQAIDETIEMTAVREVREETGLIVRLLGVLDVCTEPDAAGTPATQIVYEGAEADGELVPGPHCSEVGFFDVDDLPDGITRPSHRRVLERLRTGARRTW